MIVANHDRPAELALHWGGRQCYFVNVNSCYAFIKIDWWRRLQSSCCISSFALDN